MKSREALIVFFLVVAVIPVLATPALSDQILGTAEWVWTDSPIENNKHDFMHITDVTGSYQVSLTAISSDPAADSGLIISSNTDSINHIRITSYTGVEGYWAEITPSSYSDPMYLGISPQVGFSFSCEEDISSTYTVVQMGTSDNGYTSYMLSYTNGTNTGSVSFDTRASLEMVPGTSVPIPGSVLLLGSSLIALLGIGSRKMNE